MGGQIAVADFGVDVVKDVASERALLYEAGLRPGVPYGIGPAIDAERAERTHCQHCGENGLTYEPWIGRGHYCVLAVCEPCEKAFRW